jgi:hypothetical protein
MEKPSSQRTLGWPLVAIQLFHLLVVFAGPTRPAVTIPGRSVRQVLCAPQLVW